MIDAHFKGMAAALADAQEAQRRQFEARMRAAEVRIAGLERLLGMHAQPNVSAPADGEAPAPH